MALQHFYSRIPSRVSMFNKADSFDTFAVSDGLSREFIEREISRVYDSRPGLNESEIMRKGELPPAYCQIVAKSGELIQSKINFIARDYTGERSSFFVHSLVFSEEEKRSLFAKKNIRLLDKSAFMNDYDCFDVTNDSSEPVTDYPSKDIFDRKPVDIEKTIARYDSNMIKRFIYTVLSIACGKGKNVFVILPEELSELSERALDLTESVMQIVPDCLKDELSFVTYSGDYAKYPSFKIKFLTKENAKIPLTKGWILNFGLKIGNEALDKEVSKEIFVVEFFYELLNHADLRREFSEFFENAVESGNIGSIGFKTLSDLVRLFKCSCGLFDDVVVVPSDDSVYELLCVYEKYKSALKTENRVEIAKKLWRYPENHRLIPKTVFSKIGKLYRGEPDSVRRIYMDVALEMIHTDLMREKLFAFIKNNYYCENEEMRVTINSDLCRVFYGGFLQSQILSFFTANFSEEALETRDLILEKILLVIRTKSLQEQIFEFLKLHYFGFTDAQKERLFSTAYEMLPYGDALALAFINFIDEAVIPESVDFKRKIAESLCLIVENEQKKQTHPLFGLIVESNGFCTEAVVEKILTEWRGRKIYRELIASIACFDWKKRSEFAVFLCKCPTLAEESVINDFFKALSSAYANNPVKGNLFTIIEAESKIFDEIGKLKNEAAFGKATRYAQTVLAPLAAYSLFDLFKDRFKENGLAIVGNFIQKYPETAGSEQFDVIKNYVCLIESIKNESIKDAAAFCETLLSGFSDGQAISDSFTREIGRLSLSDDMRAFAEIIADKLSCGKYSFGRAYENLLRSKTEKSTSKKNEAALKKDSLLQIVRIASEIYACVVDIISDECDLKKSIINVASGLPKKEKNDLNEEFSKLNADVTFKSFLSECSNSARSESVGFFAKLFGKK